jgi:hypothetical protein
LLGTEQIGNIVGQDDHGSDGAKIGTARQVYADDQTGQPEWVTVRTGLFGTKETFIPLADADASGGRLTVPYTKDFVKRAPNLDDDGHLSPEEEDQLYAYYGRTDYDTASGRDHGMTGPRQCLSGVKRSGWSSRARPALVVQKEAVPVERVRLDTETVTEQQTVAGEVRKERVEVEGDVPGTDRADTDR